MSDRRSPSSFAGDDDPTPPRGNPVHRDDADWDDDDWDDDDWDEPNFLIRRALVVAGVVAAIAIVAIVASRFLGGSDDSDSSSSAGAEWNTTIVLERDRVRVLDRDSGDEIDAYDSTVDLLDAQSLVAGDVLVTMTDQGAIALRDLADGTRRLGRAGIDETLRLSLDNPLVAVAGPDSGGDMTIIDTVERNVFSVAEVAGLDDPLIFNTDVLVNTSGTHVAVPVPNAFQSFVIDIAEETSTALAGRVIALSNDIVVTEQPAGGESEVEFRDLLGERLASVDVPAPQAVLLRDDGTLLMVAADGAVRTATSDGTVDDADTLIDENGVEVQVTGGFVVADGQRLAVITSDGVIIIDESGSTIGSAAGTITTSPERAARCLIVGGGRSTAPSSVLDLDNGSVITTIETGLPAATSFDGCTAALLGSDQNFLTGGEVTEIDARSIAAVAPDGAAIIVLDGRDTEFVRIGAEDDPIEIADEPVVVHFGLR